MKEINNHSPKRGYFGKLPIFNDFVKYNAGNQEIIVMDNWLQEGMVLAKQKLKNDWKLVYRNSLPLSFFYPFTGTDKFISGVIYPSNDKSDRDFPFLIFFDFNKNIFDRISFFLEPLFFNNEFRSFDQVFNNISINTSISDLTENINQISANISEEKVNEHYQAFINSSLQEDYWLRILKDFIDEQKYFIINNILNPEIKNSTLALKFDFTSTDENSVLDMCFLINMVFVSKGNSFLPAVFWTKDVHNNLSLYIFPSKPSPLNYLDMICPTENSGRIFNVNDKIGFSQVSSSIKDFLNNDEKNLKDLLQILNSY